MSKKSSNQLRNILLSLAGAGVATVATIWWKQRRDIPKGAIPVHPFDVEKYLGTWYEIARLDYKWEKNLSNTMAEYSLNEDGTVEVTNTGFNYKKGHWQEATGVARFTGKEDVAALEVSFFGPFYTGYNVIALEGDYKYALVLGRNTSYCWILSRTPEIPEDVRTRFVMKAMELGVNVNKLVWVNHDRDITEE